MKKFVVAAEDEDDEDEEGEREGLGRRKIWTDARQLQFREMTEPLVVEIKRNLCHLRKVVVIFYLEWLFLPTSVQQFEHTQGSNPRYIAVWLVVFTLKFTFFTMKDIPTFASRTR